MLKIPWGSLHPICNKQIPACKNPATCLIGKAVMTGDKQDKPGQKIRTNKQPEIVLGIMQECSEGPLHPRHVPRKQVKRVVCTAALYLTLDSTAHHDYVRVSEMRDRNCCACSAAS